MKVSILCFHFVLCYHICIVFDPVLAQFFQLMNSCILLMDRVIQLNMIGIQLNNPLAQHDRRFGGIFTSREVCMSNLFPVCA